MNHAEKLGLSLINELGRIAYLGPIRSFPQRDYAWCGYMPSTLGDSGESTADALIAGFHNIKGSGQLLSQIGSWLQKMNLADGIVVKRLGTSGRYEILVETNGELANLRDVGIGVSQVLPIITTAYIAQQGTIIIVEEPESHLHPLAQSLLAELFLSVSKERGVQFIIETHSEHVFRRLQTLVSTEKAAPENYSFYFVARENNEATLKPLKIDKFGRIENWPDKFFGDVTGEVKEQTLNTMERMKQEREDLDNP